jgi:hypothetical protein
MSAGIFATIPAKMTAKSRCRSPADLLSQPHQKRGARAVIVNIVIGGTTSPVLDKDPACIFPNQLVAGSD